MASDPRPPTPDPRSQLPAFSIQMCPTSKIVFQATATTSATTPRRSESFFAVFLLAFIVMTTVLLLCAPLVSACQKRQGRKRLSHPHRLPGTRTSSLFVGRICRSGRLAALFLPAFPRRISTPGQSPRTAWGGAIKITESGTLVRLQMRPV